MGRPGETIAVLCNEHLHRYEVSVFASDLLCPVCGCRYGRMDTGSNPEYDVNAAITVDVREPYALPVGETWVSRLPEKPKEDKVNAND